MAMTAWAANVSSRLIWRSVNGRTSKRIDAEYAKRLAVTQQRASTTMVRCRVWR